MNSNSESKGRFRAFVSYSHADKAAAQRLHRKLETYRLPAHLRDTAIDIASDGRVGAIFRDREDLPAAQDLTESVKEALSQSAALVVLCSPDAQRSPWVAREIDLFRELHPGRPILAALLRGEPEEAFPALLREGREPLAADLRKTGDGERLGFLKVIAGIAGVPLDALINRDAQRRVRRVTAITVAAVAAMIVMALMTTFALQSRNEAQYQRQEAESVIEFMMTDLRTDLRGVGRLDVMETVNKRAVEFYAKQGDTADLPVDSALRWARILHSMGEDRTITLKDDTIDYDAAGEYFTDANSVSSKLFDEDKNDPARIFTHAQSQFWLGYHRYLQQDYGAAAKYWEEYDRLASILALIPNQDFNGVREQGFAQGNLCTLALESSSVLNKSAVTYCARSLSHMEAVWEENRDEQSKLDLVNRLNWFSRALELDDDRDASPEMHLQALKIVEDLLNSDPKNRDYQEVWLTTQMALARIALQADEVPEGLSRLQVAKQLVQKLTVEEPRNARWTSRLTAIEVMMKGISE